MFITEEELKKSFGDRTFSKGLKYFKDGYVKIGMRKGNKLIGRVLGSSFPYSESGSYFFGSAFRVYMSCGQDVQAWSSLISAMDAQ